MIETSLYWCIRTELQRRNVPCYMMRPEDVSVPYVLIEKTGGSAKNHVKRATFAFQSYGDSLAQAAETNETVKEAATKLPEMVSEIYGTRYITDYNFTNPADKIPRYQAVFDIYYYDNY